MEPTRKIWHRKESLLIFTYNNKFFDPKIEFTRNSYKEILVLIRFILLLGKNMYKRPYLPKQRERPWKMAKNRFIEQSTDNFACPSLLFLFICLFFFFFFFFFAVPAQLRREFARFWLLSTRELPDFNMTRRQVEMITEMFQRTRSHFLSEAFLTSSLWGRYVRARIHTGFHRFAKIGQIF